MVHYVPHSMPFFLHSMIFIGDFFKPLHKQLPYFIYSCLASHWDFPGSSAGKESACNAGDLSSIPGSGRSTREGIGYPLQYSWASLVAQLVKNPPARRGAWVPFLGWEDPLEKGMATRTSILAWRIPCTIYSMGLQRVRYDWVPFTFMLGLLAFCWGFLHLGSYVILVYNFCVCVISLSGFVIRMMTASQFSSLSYIFKMLLLE